VTADHFEPAPNERVWYNHAQTGDRGYAVRRAGRDGIRYDRPAIDEVSFNLGDWKLQVEPGAEFTDLQIAMVAFEADKKLCWAMGSQDLAKREWIELSEKLRLRWVKDGPPATAKRRAKLFAAIQKALREP
jgi:hypothetical protein